MSYVYILRCRDGSFYTGVAKDLERRVGEHQAGSASKYTRARRPVTLVWTRRVRTWPRALRLEYRIKQLDRAQKVALVAGRFDLARAASSTTVARAARHLRRAKRARHSATGRPRSATDLT
jgi:putative endonuclease